MTQRIFDVDNPQDVKDLFDILPDKVKTVIQDSIDSEEIELYGKDGGYIDSCAHIRVNWRDKTEIARPIDETQCVGKLCWFSDSGSTCEYIGILKAIDNHSGAKYKMKDGRCFSLCRPVRRDEIKFVEDVE